MAMQLPAAAGDARSEPPTWTALVLEMVALRHQIAVLKRSGTRRPCFRFHDRLFWLLLARWWPGWRDSLVIVQPATVLRWRRESWSGLWRYRSRGRWRGGRPRISREIRGVLLYAIKPSLSAMTRIPRSRPGTMQHDYGHPLAAPSAQAISPWSARHHRDVWYQARRPQRLSGRSWQALRDRSQVTVPMRSPPYHARASLASHLAPAQVVRSANSRRGFVTRSAPRYDRSS